jgi:hypothetical protein
MKKNLLFVAILLFITVIDLTASPASGNWRWRNDDGDEATATWKAIENDSAIQANENNIRLRMEVYHYGGSPDINYNMYLFYASAKESKDLDEMDWHMISDESSETFMYSWSPYIIHGSDTYEKLSKTNESCITQHGTIREMKGVFNISLANDQRKEYEFCIKPSPNAEFGQSFFFHIGDGGFGEDTLNIVDSNVPLLHLQKPVLTVTANDTERPHGLPNPLFSYTYSGFVDGDNESVLDVPPSINSEANVSSDPGQYNIIAYGGYDNKYEFDYVNGTLTVTGPTAIEQNTLKDIIVFPNPCKDIIFIKGEVSGEYTVRVLDITGRLLLERKNENGAIDLSSLQKGIYLLELNKQVCRITKE